MVEINTVKMIIAKYDLELEETAFLIKPDSLFRAIENYDNEITVVADFKNYTLTPYETINFIYGFVDIDDIYTTIENENTFLIESFTEDKKIKIIL